MLVLDLWGISFHAVVVFSLGKDLLFKSVLGHWKNSRLGIRNSWNHVMNISSKLCTLTKILCFEMQSGSFSIHSSFPTSVTFSSSFEVLLEVADSWLLGVFWWVSVFSERKKKSWHSLTAYTLAGVSIFRPKIIR